MPIIEYVCKACGNEFDEIILSHSDVTDEFECPKCKEIAAKKTVPSNHGFNGTYLANCRK
jgi:putative FmdB family regulatory protein